MNILYKRILELCKEKQITISNLESILGFSNASIQKYKRDSFSPSVNRIAKIAEYFNVSLDYLLGLTDIRNQIDDIINDEDVIAFQRARQNMSNQDKKRAMQLLKISFEYAFNDNDDNEKENNK